MVDLRGAILDSATSSRRSPSLRRRASAGSKSALDRRGESQTNGPARAFTDQWDRHVARGMSVHIAIPLLDSQPLNNTQVDDRFHLFVTSSLAVMKFWLS
jgi:hypothetical protein